MIKTTLLAVAIAPAFFLSPANASLQPTQSYFPGLNDADKEVYSQWLSSSFASYDQNAFLPSTEDPDNGSAVFWAIEGEDINFAVAVRATGWLGFGISEAGGMLGADVVTFQVPSSDGAKKLVDSYILEDRAAPLEDDCQDWILKSATTEGGWIIIEMSRKLDTGDQQDHQIKNDADLWNAPTRLISAWGDRDNISYHGSNKARLSVRLFTNTDSGNQDNSQTLILKDQLVASSDGYFELREDNYEIPPVETTYHYYCKSLDEWKGNLNLPQDQSMVTMIGAQPILLRETAPLLHHFAVYYQDKCDPDSLERGFVYVWAPGDDGILFPDNVGFPLFDKENNQVLMIEIHYNNPYGILGRKDSSGVRIYFTYEERDYRLGILGLGDPFVYLMGEPIDSGLTKYEFTCPGACSTKFLGNQTVTILTETLHMHKTGARMTNEVIRDNKIVHAAHVDIYEYAQQGLFRAQQEPYEILPGDGFRTTCYYRDGTKFGYGTQEEMCMAFLFYYPAIENYDLDFMCSYGADYSACEEKLNSVDLKSDEELGRFFGSSDGICTKESASNDRNGRDDNSVEWRGKHMGPLLSIAALFIISFTVWKKKRVVYTTLE